MPCTRSRNNFDGITDEPAPPMDKIPQTESSTAHVLPNQVVMRMMIFPDSLQRIEENHGGYPSHVVIDKKYHWRNPQWVCWSCGEANNWCRQTVNHKHLSWVCSGQHGVPIGSSQPQIGMVPMSTRYAPSPFIPSISFGSVGQNAPLVVPTSILQWGETLPMTQGDILNPQQHNDPNEMIGQLLWYDAPITQFVTTTRAQLNFVPISEPQAPNDYW